MKRGKPPLRSLHYQWESLLYQDESKLIPSKTPQFMFGPQVVSRDESGNAETVKLRVYYPDCPGIIYAVGGWNEWGKYLSKKDLMVCDDNWYSITLPLSHKDTYLFLVKTKESTVFLRDPASVYFDANGNSVFWDFDGSSSYTPKYVAPDTLHRPTIILQTDPVGLVAKWYSYDPTATTLADSNLDLFSYIRTCGVLSKIKELGYNTLQFLPVAQSIDGDNWKYRYLVAFPFAIHRNWGTPDSFLKLVDECHRLDIALVCDLIVSHCPHKDFALFGQKGSDIGLHLFKENSGREVYLEEHTPWGTMRFNYANPLIRKYLTESALHFLHRFRVDGFRIDNVDGILRYGDHGQGHDRPHGRLFLRELHSSIYDLKPLTLIHLESHFFYGDNAKMLVAPLSSDQRALGATAYNSSRLTYYFHKEFMPKAAEKISTWRFAHIHEEKEWGRSNSTIADFHNHDAAAGLMAERATGSYAYDAMILKRPELHDHAVGKIKAMEAIIAFGCEGRILDLMQTFLLQQGTFEHDSSVHWNLLNSPASKEVTEWKARINNLLQNHPCFWPENVLYREYVNIDDENKVLVIKRVDKTQGTFEKIWVVINLSARYLDNYAIGIDKPYLGKNMVNGSNDIHPLDSNRFELYPFEWVISLQPYEVVVIRGDT